MKYVCQNCGRIMAENKADAHNWRCPGCDSKFLVAVETTPHEDALRDILPDLERIVAKIKSAMEDAK